MNLVIDYKNRDWLNNQYSKRGLTCKQIAELCKCHPRTIHQWLVMFNIPRRHSGWRWDNLRRWRERNPDWVKHSRKKRHPLADEYKVKLSLVRRGAQNGHWKGGITAKIRGIRRSPEYYQWRKAVLRKHNSTCQQCGSTQNPQAHHKLPVIDFPDKIFDVENGEVLCYTCHKQLNFYPRRRITSNLLLLSGKIPMQL